jgi:large subunit ribosomal protein L13
MKTYSAKQSDVTPVWYSVNAEGKVLGRLATRVATVLMGKHKPTYTPHVDTGDFVVITNAAKVKITGDKLKDKTYRRYSGYPGGLHLKTMGELMAKHPERIIELAVKRMLPKTKMGRAMYLKMKVYAGAEHPHGAQQPVELNLELVRK